MMKHNAVLPNSAMGVYCGQEESVEETSSDSENSTGTKPVKKSSSGRHSSSSRGGDRSGHLQHKHSSRSGRSRSDDTKKSGSSSSRSSSRSDRSGEESDKRKSSRRHVDSSGSKSGEETSSSRRSSGASKKKEESEKKEPGQVTTIQSIYIPSPSVVRKNQSKQALLDSALEAEMKKLRRKSDSSAMLTGGKKRTTPSSNDLSKSKTNADSRKNLKRTTSVSSLSRLFENKDFSSIDSSKASKTNSSDCASDSDKKSDGKETKAMVKSSSHRPKLKRTHTSDSVSPSPETVNRSASLDRSATANTHQSLQALLTSFQRASELAEILEIYDQLKASCGVKKKTENSTEKIKQETKLAAFWIKQMWSNFEKKGAQEVYKVPALQSQLPKAKKERVLIIGGGPAGLACAIECYFLGFEVCVLEKRNYIERNNILHLWGWSMHYLSTMNAKTFYPKFGTGGIDHIGTKQLQRMMVKICLLLGITIKWGFEFQGVSASQSNPGTWEAKSEPALKDFNFNILIGADGERSRVVQEFEFERKSFKGSLSIGVTVNFENKMTSEEVCLREFGLSKIFEQKLFNDLAKKNIDLENLVYYRGETHYFVMTAKREGLIDSGVFKELHSDVESLIATDNVNYKNMQKYLTTVASTVGVPAENEIVVNPLTQKLDIQIFDFSERMMAEEAAKLIPNPNKGASNGVLKGQLLVSLVGDSLIQPFWPLGTGCNRAFLSAMDCAWMIRCIYLGESISTCIENRNVSYSKMKNILNGAIAQPYTNTTIDPLSRYGTSATFQGL